IETPFAVAIAPRASQRKIEPSRRQPRRIRTTTVEHRDDTRRVRRRSGKRRVRGRVKRLQERLEAGDCRGVETVDDAIASGTLGEERRIVGNELIVVAGRVSDCGDGTGVRSWRVDSVVVLDRV